MGLTASIAVRRSVIYICLGALAASIGINLGVAAWASDDLPDADPDDRPQITEPPKPRADGFQRVHRPGAVVVQETYDVSSVLIPLDEIHELLPRDAIPSLTDPTLESIADADWLPPTERVIEIVIKGEAVAAPLMILNYHEVANMTIAGEPVAATYCPLCDSASAISRRVTPEKGEPVVLEFGISGALYNSNVLMYDRTHLALWSQVAMKAVSGPLAGAELKHLPARVVTAAEFALRHPKGKVLSIETGHTRLYAQGAYASYMKSDRLIVDVHKIGDALPKKTLGIGIRAGDKAWFITAKAAGKGRTIETPLGPVRVSAGESSLIVEEAPAEVQTIQTFYYSWSAFHPETEVISE